MTSASPYPKDHQNDTQNHEWKDSFYEQGVVEGPVLISNTVRGHHLDKIQAQGAECFNEASVGFGRRLSTQLGMILL